jgi:hypothetical protein
LNIYLPWVSAIEAQKFWGDYYVPVGSYVWESYLMDIRSLGTQFVTKQTDSEIKQLGEKWLPFQSGMFGTSWENFLDIKKKADEHLIKVVRTIFPSFNP